MPFGWLRLPHFTALTTEYQGFCIRFCISPPPGSRLANAMPARRRSLVTRSCVMMAKGLSVTPLSIFLQESRWITTGSRTLSALVARNQAAEHRQTYGLASVALGRCLRSKSAFLVFSSSPGSFRLAISSAANILSLTGRHAVSNIERTVLALTTSGFVWPSWPAASSHSLLVASNCFP